MTKIRYFSNEELLHRFCVYMRKKDLSVSTYRNRPYALKSYFEFLNSVGAQSIYKLDGDTLPGYLEYLKKNNFTASTQNFKLKTLSAFYNWLKEENIIDERHYVFNGFCVYSYIKELGRIYEPHEIVKDTPIRKELLHYIDEFNTYFLNKGYSEDGTAIYKRELWRFISYLEDRTDVTSIKDITKKILFEYQLYVHNLNNKYNNPLSISTKQKKLCIIKRFFRFLIQHDYLETDPSTVIELPRLERGLPTVIMNDRELEAFLATPDLKTARGLRDRTIMEVLYSTGMRNNELCHLKVGDVNLEEGLVKITHAKGGIGFQRVVPIGKIACRFVERYLKESRPILLSTQPEENDYLFLNNFGARLTKNVLTIYMLHYRNKTNIRNKISAHSFRVTCATAMLKNGADVRYIQEQLGHRSLRSTQIYTRVFPKDLKKVHSQTHPREKNLQKSLAYF